jgi:hypothetical protein
MTKEQQEAIRKEVEDNRLSCETAHWLAKELNLSLAEIGRFCDEEGIRVKDCQLGCF